MKSLILLIFFALLMIAQPAFTNVSTENSPPIETFAPGDSYEAPAEVVNKPESGFFARLINRATTGGLSIGIAFVFGLFVSKSWSIIIKKVAGRASVVLKEGSEVLLAGSRLTTAINQAIKDNGKLEENSIPEVWASGKEVVAEFDDFVVSLKPKL